MNVKELVWRLSTLAHLDVEAADIYREAMGRIGEHDIAEQLRTFGAEHAAHVEALHAEIARLDGQVSPLSRELEMFIDEYRSAIASAKRQDVALLKLRGLERATVLEYSETLDAEVPEQTAELLRRHYEDERRHLRFIELTLDIVAEAQIMSLTPPGSGS